jgi:hypothetical protein
MKSVDLGNGKTAVVREYHELKRGDVKRLYRTFDETGIKPGVDAGYEGGSGMVDAAVLMLIDSWDLDVPVSMDALLDLDLVAYGAIDDATDVAVKKMLGMDVPDPKSVSLSSASDEPEVSQQEG